MRNIWCVAGEAGNKDIKKAPSNNLESDSIIRSEIVAKKWQMETLAISSTLQKIRWTQPLEKIYNFAGYNLYQGLSLLNNIPIEFSTPYLDFNFRGFSC